MPITMRFRVQCGKCGAMLKRGAAEKVRRGTKVRAEGTLILAAAEEFRTMRAAARAADLAGWLDDVPNMRGSLGPEVKCDVCRALHG